MIRAALRSWNGGGLPGGRPLVRVAFFGDSMMNGVSGPPGATGTAGYYARGAGGYAAAACGHAWTAARNPYCMTSGPSEDLDYGWDGATALDLLSSRTLINSYSGGAYSVTLTPAEAVLASGARDVVIHAGTNDLSAATAATTLTRLDALARYFVAAGRRVFLCSLLPRGGNTTAPTVETFQSRINTVNAGLPALAAAAGCHLVSWHGPLMSGGVADTACFYETPALHPNATGAARMGLALAAAMAPYLGSAFEPPAKGDAAWLNADPNLPYPETDANTDGLADGWVVNYFTTLAASLENNGDARWQRLAETGASETVHYVFCPAPANARIAAAAGSAATFRAACRYEIVSGTLGGIALRSQIYSAAYAAVVRHASHFPDSEYSAVFPAHAGLLLTEPFTIPADGAIGEAIFRFYGKGVVRLRQFGMFEV